MNGFGDVVGTKFKPFCNNMFSELERVYVDKLKIFTVSKAWSFCFDLFLPPRFPLLLVFFLFAGGGTLKKTVVPQVSPTHVVKLESDV